MTSLICLLLGFCIFARKFRPIRDTLRMPVLATLSARSFSNVIFVNLVPRERCCIFVGGRDGVNFSECYLQRSSAVFYHSQSNLCDRMLHGNWHTTRHAFKTLKKLHPNIARYKLVVVFQIIDVIAK